MSLVNDMLNDLEQRRVAQPAQTENLEWLTARSSDNKSNNGGGLFVSAVSSESVTLNNVVLSDNIAYEAGGGVFINRYC